jgi:hypothetical protein
MPRVRLTIELEVTAPVGDAVALARSVVTRQGFLVVDARVADNGTGTPARPTTPTRPGCLRDCEMRDYE